MTTTEHQLKNLKNRIALTASEKGASREALHAFMQERPVVAQSVPPPFSIFVFARYSVAAMLMLVVAGGGVAAAAEHAAPGNPLYVVKLRVNEPTQVALKRDREERADFEVELVDRRLREFAQASVLEDVDEGVTDMIIESLSSRVEDLQENIATLSEDDAEGAREASRDLYVTLAAHTEVLERVSSVNPESSDDIDEVQDVVEGHLASSESTAEVTSAAATIANDTVALKAALVGEQEDAAASLQAVVLTVSESPELLDTEDQDAVAQSLEQIQVVAEAAAQMSEQGQRREALRLYGEVNEQVTRLKALIAAEEELGVDILSE